MNGDGRGNDWFLRLYQFISDGLLFTSCPKLEARGLKKLVGCRRVDRREKRLIKSKE